MRNYFSYTINYILIKSSFYTKKGPGFVPGHHPYDFWLGPRTYFLTSTMRRVNLVYSLIQKHFALHKAQNTNCQKKKKKEQKHGWIMCAEHGCCVLYSCNGKLK